ncbi:MAG: aldo/keto reductase [Anaerolineaceae bacterium]|nr:aldo/keto reductase [Anaerolineaceae bacterium]
MIEKLTFGRTKHLSSRILLGAAAFGNITQAEADVALDSSLSHGINHVDVAASYGDAELRIGDWIKRHGRPFFLATKTGERTADRAREEIHRSLERLQVDHVNLIQLHHLIDPIEWETALGPEGALEAALQARDEGLVRFIGITGHGLTAPVMHQKALERYDFDSVLLPFSYLMAQNEQYLREFLSLVKICRERNIAIQTIKSLVHSPWGDAKQDRRTWYRPLEEQADIDLSIHWVLGHAGLFLNSVGDVHLLPRVLDAADRFVTSPNDDEMKNMGTRLGMQSLFS